MKKTIQLISDFNKATQNYLSKHPEETKFTYAIKKVSKRIESLTKPMLDELIEKEADINIELASVDDKNNIIYEVEIITDAGGNKRESKTNIPKFTPAKLREKNKKIAELNKELVKQEIDFEPYMATEVPSELTETEKDQFTDFVIDKKETE
jgi:hypothetical protein